ncbi:hypothetical protein EPR50_G00167270 [Perca flavescens]|uniref:Starch-binding domain-containing protein 1 n=1 Tax=Perca flavescens TaxID=8167 RepID=A0A484CIV6_PERFV|nr:hypothetical protein EPR50_G00167270 [Perca flavescens]
MNECRVPVIQPANEQLAPAPSAALQQQEVTTLGNVEERAHSGDSLQQPQPGLQSRAHAHSYRTTTGSAMPLNNGNTVAVERRVDLASLFCMIGRHGPAVALALVAMASLLAGFIIYRTVRGKRRKATAADDDSKSPAEESDASVIQPSSVASTEVSDEGSSDVKKDVDLIQSDLKIRHRRAAEKTPPPYSPPKSDLHIPDDKHTTSDDTDKVAVEWDSYKVAETYADRANWSRQSATSTEAEKDAVDCYRGEADDAIKDVLEEVHDKDGCWKEPEPNNDENHEEKVLKAECQEDENVTTDMDHSDKTTRQEEENVQCALTSLAPQFDEQDVEFEQKEENGLTCDQEDGVLYDDQVKEKMLTGDNTVACSEEPDSSSMAPSPARPCLSAPLKAINHDDGLSGITTDAKAQISGIAEFPDLSSDPQHPQTEDKMAPALDEDTNSTTILGLQMPSHETENQAENNQFDLRNDTSSAGVGEESGISSMTVSPDNEFDVSFENTVLPAMDCDPRKSQNLFANDAGVSVIKEDTAGMVRGLYSSRPSQPPHSERTGGTNYESFAANEDMLGHEVEDGYHRGTDQFMAQVADSVTSFTDDLEQHTDVKVVDVKEKEAGLSAKKEEENKAEKEIEVDNEMTEISIMEATMDHNEWIMDGTYQALPWMNLSAPSFAQDDTKTNQLPTEEYQRSSAVTDSARIDATDLPPSAEGKQTGALSLVDENTENSKKIGAVQPMPQHVNVTFRIHYFTQSPYQTVAVTGNQQELGNWKGFIPLERAKDGHWSTVVSLPAEIHVEWKFVVVDKGEVCRWEECGNRLLDTGNGDDLLVHKWWGRL